VTERVADICVVHLVRAKNGVEPFVRFLASYRENPGGAEHELALVFKGFAGERGLGAHLDLLGGIPHRKLLVPDAGFDIGAYFRAASEFEHEHFCFLNSFSRPLDPGWLEKMARHVRRPGVGLVGATGSWESLSTSAARAGPGRVPVLGRMRQRLSAARLAKLFAPFPNPHVRSNAFVVARRTMLGLSRGVLRRKAQAHQFESGLTGMSRQVLGMGLEILLVGRDGNAYAKDDWPRSRTFRQGGQENLLVADNQTAAYESAGREERAMLGRLAWGDAWSA
jgi:hypothetical protein